MIASINKARSITSRAHVSQGDKVPRAFSAPPSGYGYYGKGHHYAQVLNYTAWAFIAIKAHIREICGGSQIHLGSVTEKPPEDKRKSKGYRPKVKKSLNGPGESEVFEEWPRNHPAKKLFKNPNGPDVAWDFLAWDTLFFNLTGESHWWLIRDRMGVPREMWVMPTHWLRKIVDDHGTPVAYEIQNPFGQTQYALAKDVVSFYEHSPLSRWEGYAVTTAIARWLDIYDSVMTTQLATFKNGANPTLHVELDESFPNPDDASLRRYYAKWFERFQGEENAGLPVLTGPGTKINVIGSKPSEIGFEQSEEAIRNRTLAAFGVPQALVTGDPTVDTSAYAPQRTFTRFTINPTLKYKAEVITEKVLRPTWEDGLGWWDDRVAEDRQALESEIRTRKENNAISPNEVRAKYGEEPWPHGGDDPISQDGTTLPWATGKKPEREEQVDMAYAKALSGTNGSAGGYLVPTERFHRVRDEKDSWEEHEQVKNRLHMSINGNGLKL